MYWTLELASKLEDAPWPATKEELIDYAVRSGAPLEVLENLQEIEDEGDIYESIEDIWPDYPSKDDFFFNEASTDTSVLPNPTERGGLPAPCLPKTPILFHFPHPTTSANTATSVSRKRWHKGCDTDQENQTPLP